MSPVADQNLLFGIVALQMDFISRDALVAAMHAWVSDKTKSLGHVLVAQQALTPERCDLLAALVQEHVKQHDESPQRSLQSISSLDSIRGELEQIADPDVQASLAQLPDRTDGSHAPPFLERTLPLSVSTSSGVRFRFLRPWRKGGLGIVSVASDEELHREVALKEIKDEHAGNRISRERFLLEAEVTGALEHPGIVPVYGLGHYVDGRPFYAMRFVRGDSLDEAIERFHSPPHPAVGEAGQRDDNGQRTVAFRELLGRFIDVCNAIAYAHSRGVLHRDLKPGNIILGKYGETLVVDWGLAKVQGRTDALSSAVDEAPLQVQSGSGSAPTHMGAVVGTPAYMSPEQAGGRLDLLSGASDVYGLGATLYCLLTGRAPFVDRDLGDVLAKVRRGDFPRPRQALNNVPRPLEAICLKAMALEPTHRYASPTALADDLEHWLADEPVAAYPDPIVARARRWGRRHRAVLTGAVALLATAVVALALSTGMIARQKAETDRQRIAAVDAAKEAELRRQEAVAAKAETEAQSAEVRRQLVINLIERADAERKSGSYEAGLAVLASAYEACDANEPLRMSVANLIRGWSINVPSRLLLHNHRVSDVAFSPDGRQVLTGCYDNIARLWDLETSQELRQFRGHEREVSAVAFSPNGQQALTGSGDGTARLWDISTGKHVRTFETKRGSNTGDSYYPEGITLYMPPNSGQGAKGGGDSSPNDGGNVEGVAFSPDGRLVLTGAGNSAKLWNISTGKLVRQFDGHSKRLACVAISPDGRLIATGSYDQTARIWDASTGKELQKLVVYDTICSVAFSPDGTLLLTGSKDLAHLWDAASGRTRSTFRLNDSVNRPQASAPPILFNGLVLSGSPTGCAVFSPDGNRVLACGETAFHSWNLAGFDGVRLNQFGPVNSLAFSKNGEYVVTGSADCAARIWSLVRGRELSRFPGGRAAFAPNQGRLLTSDARLTRLWDLGSRKELQRFEGHDVVVLQMKFSPDGKQILTASYSNEPARLWDAATGRQLWHIGGKRKPSLFSLFRSTSSNPVQIDTIAFSPDGRRFISKVGSGTTAHLHDAVSGKVLQTYESSGLKYVNSIDFSPDGRQFLTGSIGDLVARLWDVDSGNEVRSFEGHSDVIDAVAFSPSGEQVLTGSRDNTARLWNSETGREVNRFSGHTGPVGSVAFSPDGRLVLTGGGGGGKDTSARLWDAVTGKEVRTLLGHARTLNSVGISPDGRFIVTASDDKASWLWEALPKLHEDTDAVLAFIKHRTALALGDNGLLQRISSEQWAAARDFIRDSGDPALLGDPPTQEQIRNWHNDRLAVAEKSKQWFVAVFHLDQLIDMNPANKDELIARRDQAAEIVRKFHTEKVAPVSRSYGKPAIDPADALIVPPGATAR